MTTTYSTVTYLNGTSRFGEYSDGDQLAYDARTVLLLRSPNQRHALHRTFNIGNRMSADEMGIEWSSDVRSISVGDVIVVIATRDDGYISDAGYYAVAPVGFTRLDSRPAAAFGAHEMVRLGVARRTEAVA